MKNNIKYILTGGNFSTECIREPLQWAYHASDLLHIKDIHKKFGNDKLKKFPMCNIFTYKILYRFLNNYKHLKNSLKREPTLEEISEIDQLHYNGIEAVNEAILKTKIKENTFLFFY